MAVNKKTDRVAGEMVEMATLLSKRGIVSMKKLEQIKALGTGDSPITKPKTKSQILEAVHETASDLHLKLKAFDPNVHGGEVMSTGRVGAEVF
jgi:hypothetical protein